MTLTLRPYQQEAVAEIRAALARGHRSVLFVLPTGGAKRCSCAPGTYGVGSEHAEQGQLTLPLLLAFGQQTTRPALAAGDSLMDFLSDTPQASVIEVTPELAQQLLDTSPGNRRMRSWYIDQLGAAMKSGDWLVTSQGIGIDSNGQLRDAHHRLTACVRHQSPFPSVIAWGLPAACYQVIDRGLTRDYSDILNQPKLIAEVLRLAASICIRHSRPTAADIQPYVNTGIVSALDALNNCCPTRVRYYSSAPMRLAAVVTIMNGGDADYVNQQYKALVNADYDSMSSAAKALTRQVTQMSQTAGNSNGGNEVRDRLARGVKVFDKDRQHVSKIQISDADKDAAVEFVRSVLNKSVAEHFSK